MTGETTADPDPTRPVYAVRYRRDTGAVVAVASTIASDTEHLQTQDIAVLVLDEAPPWPCHVDVATAQIVPGGLDVRSIEQIRAERWTAIKAERQALDEAPMPLRDFAIDADLQSRQDVMGAVMSMQLTGQTERAWRCSDNVMRTLTFADLVAVGTGIAARRQGLIETSDALYQQIQAAADVAGVKAVVWPAS